MPMRKPTFVREEYGVKRFTLTSDHFMNPCQLLDIMSEDDEICAAGAFVGELNNLQQYTPDSVTQQVNAVKEEIRRNVHCDAATRTFRPVVQERKVLWAKYGTLFITPQHMLYQDNVKARKKFSSIIQSVDFSNRPATKLEEALETGGINKLLDSFFDGFSEENFEIMYGPGLEMPSGEELGISPDMKMCDMNSPNIAALEHVPIKGEATTCIPGINQPTVYVGTEYSSFNLHSEDFNFESINRMVDGSEKVWFVIPPSYQNSFTAWFSQCGVFEDGTADAQCASFLQHKHHFVDPRAVAAAGFPVRTIRQRPGDVVYLLPAAIHWGINVGFNINEAVNCASSSWVKSGRMARPACSCRLTLKNMAGVVLDPVLKKASLSEEDFEDWKRGRNADVFKNDNLMNPYGSSRQWCPANFRLLLGESSGHDSLQDCKEVTTSFYQFNGPILDRFIGAMEVTVDDDVSPDRKETEELEADEMEGENMEAEEGGSKRKKVVYKCRLPCTCRCPCSCICPFEADRQGTPGLSRLQNHMKNWHKGIPKLKEKIKETEEFYDKSKRAYNSPYSSTCDRCGKVLQETSTENRSLMRHQASGKCSNNKRKRTKTGSSCP
ncbi:Lysine-specific demethylase 4B [Frankliniella fusca]|uniref:Lysine-specific demethylase 4B n=1 Tax=Frankliniella fusca TaxID=407009 RepID=A0AAE1HS27_9NEOP|nr:Lysine-specific demethylase 4B [Frankliniella fusca]